MNRREFLKATVAGVAAMNLPANLAIPQDDDWRQYVRFVKWEVLPTGGRRVIRP